MKILILGVTGQDGSYLADRLVAEGHEVHGMVRPNAAGGNLSNVHHLIAQGMRTHVGDLTDPMSLACVVTRVLPERIYNLADQDHVGTSWELPNLATEITAGAVGTLLQISHNLITFVPNLRVFQACSATMYGTLHDYVTDDTPLNPDSPYACAKAHAYHLCRMWRRRGVWVATGILFNHDSPRRGPNYLSQEIARQAVDAVRGRRERIELRGPDARVDVGWAPEYVDAMIRVTEAREPDDVRIGTGVPWETSALCREAILAAGGSNVPPKHELTDPRRDVPFLVAGDLGKIRRLGWKATTVGRDVVADLVRNLLEREDRP